VQIDDELDAAAGEVLKIAGVRAVLVVVMAEGDESVAGVHLTYALADDNPNDPDTMALVLAQCALGICKGDVGTPVPRH
jgi:hypothetical protein